MVVQNDEGEKEEIPTENRKEEPGETDKKPLQKERNLEFTRKNEKKAENHPGKSGKNRLENCVFLGKHRE